MNFLPATSPEAFDAELQAPGASAVLTFLRARLPERLARALCEHSGIDPARAGNQLKRESRRALTDAVTQLPRPINGSRG